MILVQRELYYGSYDSPMDYLIFEDRNLLDAFLESLGPMEALSYRETDHTLVNCLYLVINEKTRKSRAFLHLAEAEAWMKRNRKRGNYTLIPKYGDPSREEPTGGHGADFKREP